MAMLSKISNGVKDLIKKFIPSILLSWYHFLLAFLGAVLYQFPSKRLKIIGVTGTNGKSTTVNLITNILEAAGYKVASLSSIKFKIGKKEWPNTLRMTMPGRLKLQRFLRQAVNSGCRYTVLEVTSEGIKQYRHKFIDFGVAVFTNLAPEHIEAHGSFEKYRKAKGKLFQATKGIHIINLDDENTQYFLQFPAEKKIGFTIETKSQTNKRINILSVKNYKISSDGLKFFLNNIEFNLNLLGKFNIYNALAAICVGLSQDVNLKTCKVALEKIEKIPGRMELVIKKPFKVFVDYAITPNALEKVYQNIRKLMVESRKSKVVCVLGACGGGRDKWKRPVLGELAAKYCNEVIITNEDPYDEDPYQILSMIKSGISKFQGVQAKLGRVVGGWRPISNFYEILDRREAIKKALSLAEKGDIVIITGKGCEPCICVAGGKRIPWDDRQVVREEFKKLFKM